MRKVIEAPEPGLGAEMIGTGATKEIVSLATSMTRMAGSLPRTEVGARAVLLRLLGPPGPLRREAEHREQNRRLRGRRVRNQ